jgi:acyl-CoA synthetase (AMP-forming)/AMP-acid ligase II
VLGRRSDLIVSGGENIYPAEVEAALTAHPRVRGAAVVGMPSAKWGASPFAFVVGDVTEAELADWLDGRLARFKHPKGVALLEALPLLANGKVDRRQLRSELSERGYVG